MIKRIGWACKYLDKDGVTVPEFNFRSTTLAWLNRQTRDVAVERLWDIMQHNINSLSGVIRIVGNCVPEQRMMRIGSNMFPMYTERNWKWFWQQTTVQNYIEKHLSKVGELARALDIRLSFHPGQYCVLASLDDDIVNRSIAEFESHTDIARWMGYGNTWHDHGLKINVHISGRRGADGILAVMPRLSTESRNLLTIENDENSHGVEDILALEKHVALVLDIHHHWIRTGEYINVQDDRVQRIFNSWRGVRPTIHYSLSKESELKVMDTDTMPNLQALQESGHKRQKLRAHSDMMWNRAANVWALEFLPYADIMVEAKSKNLAADALYQQYLNSIS